MDVIEKIDHSEWASPTVYVKKKSKEIRVYADFSTGLNKALKEHHYPLPSPQEIFAKLAGGKYFSKIDLSDAYLQIPVDEESSKLLCINTHKGLYKFKRLPFGVKVAPAIFQQTMDMMLNGLDFAVAYLDDVLISSASKDRHKAYVKQVFKRIQDYGFKVKDEKCTFFMDKIKYLGQIIDEHGRRPDPDRAIAIKNMPAPENIASLQSFLGLANYYNVFVPRMHNLRAPLNELLKKDQKWVWTQECEEAFKKIKDILTSDLFLAHYNPKHEIVVASDASAYGIGACILHKMDDGKLRPISHASRTLLPAERNYSQIEKEALSIVFAVKKFHRFLHGRHFLLQTDHKPLLTIFGSKKGLPQHTANRLQRWGTILLNYNFQMEYVPSKKLGHADGLSRLIPKQTEPLEDMVIAAIQAEAEVKNTLCDTVRELPVTLDEIKSKAEVDEFILSTKEKINNNQLNEGIFSICDNVLLYSDRVVIPTTLQKRMLKEFHVGHPGISRMKSLMRSFVYWTNMDKDIEEKVRECRGCALAMKAPPTQFGSWPKPDRPWSRIHLDFAGPLDGFYYLIVVDSLSKWPEVLKCKNPTSEVTINFLYELFARFGVVDCIVTDNGTQFTSTEFRHLCEDHLIEHITIPPYHPRSNGQAERFVDTFKRALKKASGSPTDKAIQQFLQVYRVTPNANIETSKTPAEVMFGRKVRSIFHKLLPSQDRGNLKRPITKKRYKVGEKVFFKVHRNNRTFWESGTVDKQIGNMVYMIKGPDFVHKRHTNQIRKRYANSELTRSPGEDIMDTVFDTFQVPIPDTAPENRRSKRKRKSTELIMVNPKQKRY
jgi:hypothetical protein